MTALVCHKVQEALYAHLTNDSTLMALLAGIYDEVPTGSALPYLTFGETRADGMALKDRDCSQISFDIMLWSEDHGQMEVKELMAEVERVMKSFTPDVLDISFGTLTFVGANIVRQITPERMLYRGRLSYRIKAYEDAVAL
ncbi:DUF3168 domain-containing protein [Kordiimonas sp.]|uniref:DUF3168 domain-containing protein n=1 Tax=Kordiimonas sp. TaxID=1970157 RepID=UPI003A8DFF67